MTNWIDWTHFTPGSALMGGALIGLATAALLLFNGRIAGISGIIGGLLRPIFWGTKDATGERAWRLVFLAGLLLAPVLYGMARPLPAIEIQTSTPWLIVAGLLVGIGTRYGAGCTSGHGVCGLARFSLRSLVATLCFMLSGFVTTFVLRHVFGG